VEFNPVRPALARRAEQWRWGSCHVRQQRGHPLRDLLSDWPVDRPARWLETVNLPMIEAEENAVREAIRRDRPLGSEQWIKRTAATLNLEHTLRPRGRPIGWRKKAEKTEK
jgi:putative transposase